MTNRCLPSPVSPGPMFIRESRCTKWAEQPLIQVQFEKNYKDCLEIRLKDSRRRLEEADKNLCQALERAERRASELAAWAERTVSEAVQRLEANKREDDAQMRLEAAQRMLEEADNNLCQALERAERRASELVAWAERTLSEAVQRLEANKREGEAERREEEAYKILSEAMERVEGIKKEGQKMEDAKLFELNERFERRASEFLAACLEEAQEEVAHSGRDSWAEGQIHES